MIEFKLKTEYIELIQLLKAAGVCGTGGQAKMMVEDGLVRLNGNIEFRKRAKLRSGDMVEVYRQKIRIV